MTTIKYSTHFERLIRFSRKKMHFPSSTIETVCSTRKIRHFRIEFTVFTDISYGNFSFKDNYLTLILYQKRRSKPTVLILFCLRNTSLFQMIFRIIRIPLPFYDKINLIIPDIPYREHQSLLRQKSYGLCIFFFIT